jgi:hypothetical protein
MEAKLYAIYNQTRQASVSEGVTAVNSMLEPLAALRVMVEGLSDGSETGLWLTHVTVVPMAPRMAPFDLIYLDKDNRVVERAELLPTTEMPRFKKPATSALVLPFHTISSLKIETGDQFSMNEVEEPEQSPAISEVALQVAPKPDAKEPVAPPVEKQTQKAPFESPFVSACIADEAVSAASVAPEDTAAAEDDEEQFTITKFLRNPKDALARAPKADSSTSAEPVTSELAIMPQAPRIPAPGAAASDNKAQWPTEVGLDFAKQGSSAAQSKTTGVNRFFRWLYPALYDVNRRTSDRFSSDGLVAYDFVETGARMHQVVNLSSHGVYLRTKERWPIGSVVSLTLQLNGPLGTNLQDQVRFHAVVAREGADGVGFSFALPEGMELKLWDQPGRSGADPTDPIVILRELRMARALAFMRRICPSAAVPITALFHKTLSNVRLANVVEVVLKAERLLAQEPNAYCMVAHPDLTLRILDHGSWVDAEWLQDLWAGLLATSCTFEGQDESNLVYINLLSKLSPLPTQILTMACAKAMQAMTESAEVSPSLLAFSADEIAKITRSNNLNKIYKSIAELSELGLVEKNPRSANAKAKPTDLGLEMFARCQGIRGAA